MGEKVFFIIIGLALSFGVGYMGSKRKIGFGLAFLLAILNILVGLIVVMWSPKIKSE